MKALVIGAGSWGTTLAWLLAEKKIPVTLWSRSQPLAEEMAVARRNPRYVSNLVLPPTLALTSDLSEDLVASAAVVVFAVPSHAMREQAAAIARWVSPDTYLVSVAKGIEPGTRLRMSQVLEQEISSAKPGWIAVLSGPNHAEEVSREIPTASVVASSGKGAASELQSVFGTSAFRVYTNKDVVGVELGGATKNIIAIAAGISDGLGFGDNTKASLMTRGLAEMTRLGTALGAKAPTFSGLAGMGDLIVTCISPHSRNRAVGERLGQGLDLDAIMEDSPMVAEGVLNSKAFHELARERNVKVPITDNVYEVLYRGKDPTESVRELMTREATEEIQEATLLPPDRTV